MIGNLDKLGGDDAHIFAENGYRSLKYIYDNVWKYWDGSNWITDSENDIHVEYWWKAIRGSITVALKNDSLAKLGTEWQGTYEISAPVNGQLSWTLNSTSKAIWFISQKNYWLIGNLDKRGGDAAYIFAKNEYRRMDDIGDNVWKYWDGSNWITDSENDIDVKYSGMIIHIHGVKYFLKSHL